MPWHRNPDGYTSYWTDAYSDENDDEDSSSNPVDEDAPLENQVAQHEIDLEEFLGGQENIGAAREGEDVEEEEEETDEEMDDEEEEE